MNLLEKIKTSLSINNKSKFPEFPECVATLCYKKAMKYLLYLL